jgi:hypothetical protein
MSSSATPSMVTAPIYSTVHTTPHPRFMFLSTSYCSKKCTVEELFRLRWWFGFFITLLHREREREWVIINYQLSYHVSVVCGGHENLLSITDELSTVFFGWDEWIITVLVWPSNGQCLSTCYINFFLFVLAPENPVVLSLTVTVNVIIQKLFYFPNC